MMTNSTRKILVRVTCPKGGSIKSGGKHYTGGDELMMHAGVVDQLMTAGLVEVIEQAKPEPKPKQTRKPKAKKEPTA